MGDCLIMLYGVGLFKFLIEEFFLFLLIVKIIKGKS